MGSPTPDVRDRMGVRLRLIVWKAEAAEQRAEGLRALGYSVDARMPDPPALARELLADPPAALVIDLSSVPSRGRDLGVWLRQRKGLRRIPLVFAGGAADKVAALRALLPDAGFTAWDEIDAALATALHTDPGSGPTSAEPRALLGAFAAYAGKPLLGKLTIRAGSVVGLVSAPDGFDGVLGALPPGAELRHGACSGCDVCLWFVRSRADLDGNVAEMAAGLGRTRLWIAWTKQTAAPSSAVTQRLVREAGLATGLVDFKILLN